MTAKPSADRVQRRRHHAVVGRDAHHLDRVHAGAAQPVGEARPRRGRAPRSPSTPPRARPCRRPPRSGTGPAPGAAPRRRSRPRSAAASCRRSPASRRSARRGRCGGPGWRRRGRSRPRRGGRRSPRRPPAPPATASEPPSVKSFCTSTTSAASVMSPSTSDGRQGGLAAGQLQALPRDGAQRPAQVVARAASSAGPPDRPPTRDPSADQRHLQQPVVLAELRRRRGGRAPPRSRCRSAGAGAARSSGRRAVALCSDRLATGRPVDLDQLVDHAGGRRAGAGHHRGAHPVRVDRGGGQRRRWPTRPGRRTARSGCRSRRASRAARGPGGPARTRSPESIRTAPSSGPATSTAVRMPGRCRRCPPAAWCRCRARRAGPGTRPPRCRAAA